MSNFLKIPKNAPRHRKMRSSLVLHISRTKSASNTELGINHLKIRDEFVSWTQKLKTLSRTYKKQTKRSNYRDLSRLLSRKLLVEYFQSIFNERKECSMLPKQKMEEDYEGLLNEVAYSLDKELGFVVVKEDIKRKLLSIIKDSVFIVNCVVLIRPLAKFQFAGVGDSYDPSIHEIKNNPRENLRAENVEEEDDYFVFENVFPSYTSRGKVFRKAGVVIKKRTLEDTVIYNARNQVTEINQDLNNHLNKDWERFMDLASQLRENDSRNMHSRASTSKSSIQTIVRSIESLNKDLEGCLSKFQVFAKTEKETFRATLVMLKELNS